MPLPLAEALQALPGLRLTVEAHGLMAKKALGQNFLLDANITSKIIRLSLERQKKTSYEGDFVFEVGPGPGGLTRAVLSHNPEKLTVVEMDERCIAIMEDIKNKVGNKLEIINGNALEQNFACMDSAPRHIVSNLPYNISVPLLIGWLKEMSSFASLTLMFQKEVAERITAPINSKDYGRISVLAQLTCHMTKLLDLNPECFVPAPKIWSSVLLFTPRTKQPTARQIKNIEHLTTLAFGQRRKMIRQNLKQIPEITSKLAALNIPDTYRAEQLTPEQYLALADML